MASKDRMAQTKTQFGYRRHADQDRTATEAAQYPVVAVGAGPVGLTAALLLATTLENDLVPLSVH